MTKLLILDKDGTLIRPKSGNKYVQRPDDQELIPGIEQAIALYAAQEWSMAMASNQRGVEAGYKTRQDAIDEMKYCMGLLDPFILCGCLCPDLHGLECYEVRRLDVLSPIDRGAEYSALSGSSRKPHPGMLQYLRLLFADLSRSSLTDVLYIGDAKEDQYAAQAAGVPFIWASDWRGDRPSVDILIHQ